MLLRGEALRGIVIVGQRILYWIQRLELYCTKNCKHHGCQSLFQARVERELSMYIVYGISLQWEPFHTILYYTILYYTIPEYLTILYILYYTILYYAIIL